MAYWGTDAPTVKLLDNEGTQIKAVVLPRPTERLAQGWLPEFESPGTTLNWEDVTVRRGYRFHAQYSWVGVETTEMTKLLEVLNWPEKMRLWPHKDGTARMLVRLGKPGYGFPLGMVKYDEMNLEFIGIQLVARVPDPQTDIVVKAFRRATIQAAEQSGS